MDHAQSRKVPHKMFSAGDIAELQGELARLCAVNAELLAALRACHDFLLLTQTPNSGPLNERKWAADAQARAALAKASA